MPAPPGYTGPSRVTRALSPLWRPGDTGATRAPEPLRNAGDAETPRPPRRDAP